MPITFPSSSPPSPTTTLESPPTTRPSTPPRTPHPLPPIKLTPKLQLIHIILLARQILQPLPLTLRNHPRRQHTQEHEESEDLHDAVDPGRRVVVRRATLDHRREEDLGDHSTEFA